MTISLRSNADNSASILNQSVEAIHIDTAGKPDLLNLPRAVSGNGFYTLPGGIIIQWGTVSITTTAANTVAYAGGNWPTPFLSALLSVTITPLNPTASSTNQLLAAVIGEPNLTQYSFGMSSGLGATTKQLYFIAIGK